MIRKHILWCVFSFLFAFRMFEAPASAASISEHDGIATIEGTIEKGDCEKLLALVSVRDEHMQHIHAIRLASPGGELLEAMKIGRLVRAMKLGTIVPNMYTGESEVEQAKEFHVNDKSNLTCSSACFFIFVSGVIREKYNYWGSPSLGLHSPFVASDDVLAMSSDQYVRFNGQLRKIVEMYLSEMGLSNYYDEVIFSVPKDNVEWLSNDRFEKDLEGINPALKEWMDVHIQGAIDRLSNVAAENLTPDLKWMQKILTDPDKRIPFVLDQLQFDAWVNLMFGADNTFLPRIFDTPESAKMFPKKETFCH